MFPPSSPLLSLSLTSSIESDYPNYSTSDPNLTSTSSFIRHHSLYFLDLTEMDSTNTQSLSQSNPSSSNYQPSIDLSDPMLSTISDQPSMDFHPGQIPTCSDYGLQSFTPTTSTDLSTNFLLEDNAFRSTDGINCSPHLTGLQLGIFDPTFDRLIQSSSGSGLNHSDQDFLQPSPNQNQHHHQQIFSFQPLIHSSVSSDSIPRATQNPILDYPSGLGVPYPLDLQSTPLPNLGGFLSCFESPPTSFLTQAPEPEVGIPAEEGLADAPLQVNSARCTDWHSFVSSSPSSTDERSQSPGELGQGSNLFLFSTPTVRGNTGETEDSHTGVRMIDLEGVRNTEDLFGEGLSKRSWWNQPISSVLPTNTRTDDHHNDSSHHRICSTTTSDTTTTTTAAAAGVARRIFGPNSISRKSKSSTNTTLNKRTGNILIGSSSEQILDYNLMPTKRSRGRRPPVSPEVGLPMNLDGNLNFDLEIGLQSVPGGKAFDPNLNPNSNVVKFCELTKTGKPKKIFVCQVRGCGKCFKRSEHLKRHVRSIHTNHKPYRCPWIACNKSFSRHDNLNQHLRVHRVEEGGEILNGLHISSDGILRSDLGELRIEPELRGLRNVEILSDDHHHHQQQHQHSLSLNNFGLV